MTLKLVLRIVLYCWLSASAGAGIGYTAAALLMVGSRYDDDLPEQ